ncbi:long-chain-fatty-acid--CoA ligase 1-like [Symsagittifera roscoffensis]|uniref:long-chain-fatty-acid--CoA ligase 1-like n=1 Tax=Symsagittifera roscoffensis TaxID=84072 RepID=UPI00307C43EE
MIKSVINDHLERSRISVLCSTGKIREHFFDDIKQRTNYELFQRGLRYNRNGRCLGTREENSYVWKTYSEVDKLASTFGTHLVKFGLEPHKNEESLVGIYSKNRWEFDVTQLACAYYSLVPVPIYDTLGKEGCSFIVSQGNMRVICVDGLKSAAEYLSIIEGSQVECLIYYSDPSAEDTELLFQAGIQVMLFQELCSVEATADDGSPIQVDPAYEEDLATILYTSGTTGMPKGVMLTHKAFGVVVGSADLYLIKANIRLDSSDLYLSYLPSAHSFNSVCTYAVFYTGSGIGYYSGSVLKLMEDIQILKPTFFPIVPRLLNRLYDQINQGVKGAFCLKRKLFERAMEGKLEQMSQGVPVSKDSLLSRIAFKKAREVLGGQVRVMLIGSAPISDKVLNFGRVVMGCEILECYGQTETCAAAFGTLPFQYEAGRVGGPLPCCECKLVDIPEMDYFASRDQGEICFRGPNMFRGYFKDPEKTREAIDDKGWVHSGDVGQWLSDGSLKIIDRKKHIFKLSQGEYIAPEKLESAYVQIPLIAQMFLHGDSLESCTVAIVVPDEEVLRSYCEKKKIGSSGDTFEQLCRLAEIKASIMDKIKEKAKENQFNSLEVPKMIFLSHDLFTVENDLLTPTMKSKRPALKKFFENEINEMYLKINQ